MALRIARLLPRLLLNRLRHGRFLDILITHAPPRGIHDQPDRCHQGFAVFRPFLRLCRPRYHLHGHIHVYNHQQTVTRTRFHDTVVLNVYGFRELRVPLPAARAAPRVPRRAARRAHRRECCRARTVERLRPPSSPGRAPGPVGPAGDSVRAGQCCRARPGLRLPAAGGRQLLTGISLWC